MHKRLPVSVTRGIQAPIINLQPKFAEVIILDRITNMLSVYKD